MLKQKLDKEKLQRLKQSATETAKITTQLVFNTNSKMVILITAYKFLFLFVYILYQFSARRLGFLHKY